MHNLKNLTFQLNEIEYSLEIVSRISPDGYNLNFEAILKEKSNQRVIFQTVCGDWLSLKDVVESYFNKIGQILNVDPNTVERARDGFLKN